MEFCNSRVVYFEGGKEGELSANEDTYMHSIASGVEVCYTTFSIDYHYKMSLGICCLNVKNGWAFALKTLQFGDLKAAPVFMKR
ncbi:hypothetical protein A0J61_04491 [Choanephora cucurbitarum]|uniref:Uncharacterized protein n=1 Tax=Choanephora cucurbitarum TaxID=101091 RepID=A0A1C7NJH8_9FUNG|nr:hypothetical protein A0J61_04491 [Choanephora cucurbitarum]